MDRINFIQLFILKYFQLFMYIQLISDVAKKKKINKVVDQLVKRLPPDQQKEHIEAEEYYGRIEQQSRQYQPPASKLKQLFWQYQFSGDTINLH
jgi:hypothetical protein